MLSYTSNSQAGQEKFVLNTLNHPFNGYFLEFGALDPRVLSNTYCLDTVFNWKGLSFDCSNLHLKWLNDRKNSTFIHGSAHNHDYKNLFSEHSVPNIVDYLQIDIDPAMGNLHLLKQLKEEVFHDFKFKVITYEHDFKGDTSLIPAVEESREIFKNAGYVPAFLNVHNLGPGDVFEDWYVHPDLVNMSRIKHFQTFNINQYVKNPYPFIGKSIKGAEIIYT
jgi:hypothetical protein